MKTHFCKHCNKILAKSDAIDALIICNRCKTHNYIKYVTQQSLLTINYRGENIAVESIEAKQ